MSQRSDFTEKFQAFQYAARSFKPDEVPVWRQPAGATRQFSYSHAVAAGDTFGDSTTANGGGAHDPKNTTICLAHPSFAIWGANTDVGKTLFSVGLGRAFAQDQASVLFLKPVQTGFPNDCDSRLVATSLGVDATYGPHAAWLLSSANSGSGGATGGAPGSTTAACNGQHRIKARTVFAWHQPVSPHIAVETEGRPVADSEVQAAVAQELAAFHSVIPQGQDACALVETAGGVASPGPSGTLQCDLLRGARLPAVLVGDGRLGGISATIAAFEVLRSRGYDVPAVLLMDYGGGARAALYRHLSDRVGAPPVEVVSFPVCPPPETKRDKSRLDPQLKAWLDETRGTFDDVALHLRQWHRQRVSQLSSAAAAARRDLWWPFTQHQSVSADSDVMVIDSRSGEDFAAFRPATADSGPAIAPRFDACASWWTQGTSADVHPQIVAAVAHAAGRYGHVMFPENAHQPALDVASRLLASVGAGWASRVFFSDDGSTAVEVALKMAFRKFGADHGLSDDQMARLQVVGLDNAYHGDTLGAMCAVSGSPFNGPRQFPWYEGRGLFMEPPSMGMSDGVWHVRLPTALQGAVQADHLAFATRDELYDLKRDETELAGVYGQWVGQQLDSGAGAMIGAAIIEPLLQGSGGMVLVDPLFQRQLVAQCRQRRIPVIFDEVFSGLWRLGAVSAARILGVQPDIACYAKLLTGGLLPLAVTLATPEVFQVFQGAEKTDALLHGHSYTAHPMGCAAAVAALDLYADPDRFRAGSGSSGANAAGGA
eukprot:CAMPEP_0206139432 /NCGR_PEP_ID=MMETSP1473-20131121/6079_1 /ASSEMBLY_ACC=CAM_ASM_001109 /TAXON_ID=1461547 /ORGANISM="Stichococcus sp, Strain RCC1054" /LENGTH=768 /DNA_ID=CAMNT_0053533229 /DNA_START=85 /DNA_END=2388 /DNA_ORIENTATION=-